MERHPRRARPRLARWGIVLTLIGVVGTACQPLTPPVTPTHVAGIPAGTALQESGAISVTTDGAVIDAMDVEGQIAVRANNVTIRRTKVTYAGYHSIRVYDGFRGLVVEDSEIACADPAKTSGIVFGNYTARRVVADGCRTAFVTTSGNAVVEQSYADGELVGAPTSTTPTTDAPTTPTTPPTTTTPPTPTTPPATTPPPTTTPPTTPPPTDGHPTAATTGVRAGVALQRTGTVYADEPGQVVDGLDVSGSVIVTADDVTIRNTRVTTNGARYGIEIRGETTGTVIEDVDVVGTDTNCSVGIVHSRYTARRVDVSGCGDGIRVGPDTLVEDSYIHDQRKWEGTHNDAIQTMGGSNITIRRNTVAGPWKESTSALIMMADLAPIDRLTIEGNLLSGGTYTVYLNAKEAKGMPLPTNVVIRGNTWVADSWKYGSHTLAGSVSWSDNTLTTGKVLAR